MQIPLPDTRIRRSMIALLRRRRALLCLMVVLVVGLSLGAPVAGHEPGSRIALLVGVNDYQAFPDLKGCANDVASMRGLLVARYGFDDADIVTLVDQDATRDRILDTMRTHLINNARRVKDKGDEAVVVFHFSGHGAQIPDQSGDESVTGTDGLDEALVPQDAADSRGFIRDDELDRLFTELATFTSNVTCIFDTCHSGTITKSLGTPRSLGVFESGDAATDTAPATPTSSDQPYAMISAALADELAWSFYGPDGKHYGTLTYHLVRELASRETERLTYRDIMDAVRLKVMSIRPQTPGIAGARLDHLVFGVEAVVPDPHFLVSVDDDGGISVLAGAVLGLTPGSTLAVYPPGTRELDGSVPETAIIELSSVEPTRASATRLSGENVADGSRAVVRTIASHAQPLPIFLDGLGDAHADSVANAALLAELRTALEADESMRDAIMFVTDEADAAMLVTSLDTETFGILIGGAMMSSSAPLDDQDRVVNQIRHWIQWLNLLHLESPRRAMDVRLTVTDLSDGVGALASDGGIVLHPGEKIRIDVENRSTRDVFFALIDLASDGSRSLVFPPVGQAERLPAGDTWSATTTVSIPPDREAVFDYLKLIAFDTSLDVSGINMDAAPKGLGDEDRTFAPLENAMLRTKGVGRTKPQSWVTEVVKMHTRRP